VNVRLALRFPKLHDYDPIGKNTRNSQVKCAYLAGTSSGHTFLRA
jgi:hypothetical protein